MKARITTLFATAVVALAVAGGALAAPQQNSIRGWSHGPSTSKNWTVKPWGSKTWDYTRPGAVKPNPTSIRGSYDAIKPNPWSIRLVRPNPSCIRGAATAV